VEIVYHASHGSYIENKLSRKTISDPLFGETPKDIATKSGETHVWDRALPSCKFSRRLAQDICPRAKHTYFSL